MIYPTIHDLTKDKFNRYELTIAAAKCARLITDEYVSQRGAAESALAGTKDSGSTILSMIDANLADVKAVKNAIDYLYRGEYTILEATEDTEEAIVED